ncbi:MAG: amino acid ABC transporter substrate-binding protein [Candidatus Rokubacteria bacterium]|nr:amino acid ABC transporter substrate-binding protein [Candidatus Rokubacteria bacterium]
MGSERRFPSHVVLAFVSGLLAIAVGCPAQAQPRVVAFGAAVSLSGTLAHEGQRTKDAYEFWKDLVNSRGGINIGGVPHKIEIRYYDDQSDATTAAKLVEKLVTVDGVKLILGPFGSGATFAASTVTEKYRVPMVEGMGIMQNIFDRGYRYVFTTISTTAQTYAPLFDLLMKLPEKPRRIALSAQSAAFPLVQIETARRFIKTQNLEEVYYGEFPSGTKDFSSMLLQIKERNPQVYIGTGYLNEHILLVKQMKELGVNLPMVVLTLGPTYPDFRTALGKDAEYLVSDSHGWHNEITVFRDAVIGTAQDYTRVFKQKFGYVPDSNQACATAAGLVFQLALEKAGTTNPVKVREAIASLDVTTFLGPIKYNEAGVNVKAFRLVGQVQQGEYFAVHPSAYAQRKVIYPAPKWSER